MVLLTMTSAMVEAVNKYLELQENYSPQESSSDPPLSNPEVGKPISHGQIVDIAKFLKQKLPPQDAAHAPPFYLAHLLKGSSVYVEPAKPKPEQTTEYKELMMRLRRDEAAKAYEKMLNKPPPPNNPFLKFTAPRTAAAWDLDDTSADDGDDVKFAEVNRQMALIANVLLSIIATGVAIWMVAGHWSAPTRLALSMMGAIVIGVAEVVIYASYIRKLTGAKTKERSKKEVKTVTDTWVIEGGDGKEPIAAPSARDTTTERGDGVRHRKGKTK